MRVGRNYLVHLGDWHTFVGHCGEQLGPLTYALTHASKVDISSAGDRWHDLCAGGDAALRLSATYWHQPGECVVPLSIVAVEWFGELPNPSAKDDPDVVAARLPAPAAKGRKAKAGAPS